MANVQAFKPAQGFSGLLSLGLGCQEDRCGRLDLVEFPGIQHVLLEVPGFGRQVGRCGKSDHLGRKLTLQGNEGLLKEEQGERRMSSRGLLRLRRESRLKARTTNATDVIPAFRPERTRPDVRFP